MNRLVAHTLRPDPAFLEFEDGRAKFTDFLDNGEEYGQRVIPTTYPGDALLVPRHLQAAYNHAVEYFGQLGLATAGTVVTGSSLRLAHQLHPDRELSVYAFDNLAHSIVPNPRWLRAISLFGEKNNFMKRAQEKGWAVPETHVVEPGSPQPDLDSLDYPVMIKPDISSNGKGVDQANNPSEARDIIAVSGSRYQIQKFIDAQVELSVQYSFENGKASHLATTTLLTNEDNSHAGNAYPAKFDPRGITDTIAEDAANEGMQGVVGFDVLVDQDGNFFVSECNARYTGASYPAITAMRLGGQEWMSWTPQTTLYNPADIQFNGAGYDASRQGAVVMNRARLASHRVVETLLIGPPDTYSEMMRAVHGQLNPNRNNVRAFRPRQPLQAEDVSAHKRAKVA